MALAQGLLRAWNGHELLQQFVRSPNVEDLKVLEINKAGTLCAFLAQLPFHQLITYPDSDMMNLPFADCTWDFVVDSDTLEHVPDPLKGLSECRRVTSSRTGLFFHHSYYRWENDTTSEGLGSQLPRFLSESRRLSRAYGIWRGFLDGDDAGGLLRMPHFLIAFPGCASHRRSAVGEKVWFKRSNYVRADASGGRICLKRITPGRTSWVEIPCHLLP